MMPTKQQIDTCLQRYERMVAKGVKIPKWCINCFMNGPNCLDTDWCQECMADKRESGVKSGFIPSRYLSTGDECRYNTPRDNKA